MEQRFRNSPPIKDVIREFLARKGDAASFQEVCEHVQRSVTLVSKTPRNSIFSILTRMPDVERVGPAKYKLTSK